jgi:AraC family transcriptional regulator
MLNRLEVVVGGHREAVMPTEPTLSSYSSPWKGFVLEKHDLHALEMPDHWVPYHLVNVGLMVKPQKHFWFEGGREHQRDLTNGVVNVMSPRELRRCRWDGNAQMIAVAIEPEAMRNLVPDSLRGRDVELITQVGNDDSVLRNLLFRLQAEFAAQCPSGPLYGESLCTRLAIEMMKKYSVERIRLDHYKGGLAKPQLRRVLDYVDSFLDQNLNVDELARVAGLSRYHFGKAFKHSTGTTVHSYVLSRRIWRAQELLLQRGSSLLDVAGATGFSNQSHFTTIFTARIGISPGAYRSRHWSSRALGLP